MLINKKEEIVAIDKASKIKEMNKISEEIFRLFDKLIENYKIKMNKNEEFKENDRINRNEEFKKILSLLVEIYNIYIVNQNENKNEFKPIDKNQIIELETNFQKECHMIEICLEEILKQDNGNKEGMKVYNTKRLGVFLLTIANHSSMLFEKFKDREDSNVKDSENKVFMREFLKKWEDKHSFINKSF